MEKHMETTIMEMSRNGVLNETWYYTADYEDYYFPYDFWTWVFFRDMRDCTTVPKRPLCSPARMPW